MIHHIHITHPLKEAMKPVGRLARCARGQRGQALLVAVLLMMAILLVGALFVAIVNYNQESSTRHSDMVAAQGLAEAGIRYANYMLQYSPEGADWRPPFVAGTEPPVVDNNGNYSPGVSGPDGVLYTDDDYYSDQEIQHGWCPLVDAVSGEYIRFGFSRYPNDIDDSDPLRLKRVNINRGHFLLRVTYDPDPPYEPNDPQYNQANPQPDPLSRYIRIESIGVVDDIGFVFRRLVAYKPLALTDYLLFVTDRTRRAQPTILGYNPWIDMNRDNILNFFSHEFYGPMRFNTPVQLEGHNQYPTATPPLPIDASTTVFLSSDPAIPLTPDRPGELEGGGYLRQDRFESTSTITESYAAGTNFNLDGTDDVLPAAITSGYAVEGTAHLSPPNLFARDPATNTMRWYALTRDSGQVVLNPGPPANTYNVGQFGHGQGIYIDNYDPISRVGDLQFDEPPFVDPNLPEAEQTRQRINWLIQDWLHNVEQTGNPYSTSGSCWNQVGEVYLPPGVEIELFPSYATAIEDPLDDVDHQYDVVTDPSPGAALDNDYTDADGGVQIWWPNHVAGEPGIRLTRTPGGDGGFGGGLWCIADPNNPGTIGTTTPQTRTMYLDYPLPGHQVIFAEGNVRIKGRLPRPASVNSGDGSYNLTVVSGGTIYIDGQLLSSQDQWGRQVTGGSLPGGIVSDQDNTYIALLARDCVVVNPTMLVPQHRNEMRREVDDTDPNAYHWVRQPTATDPYMDSAWYFGADPVAAGNTVNLVVRQTRKPNEPTHDPALDAGSVAAATMNIYNGQTSITSPYFFDTTGIAWDDSTKFVLASLSAWLPGVDGSIGVPPDYQVPQQWAPAVRPPTWLTTPWSLGGYISADPGDLNSLTIRPVLPSKTALGEFFYPFVTVVPPYTYVPTDYWLKKFKIEELGPLGPTDPRGAIHAKINAIMYAERGCFFVIPAPYFDEDATSQIPRFLRYNYDIEIRGAITENFHPGPAAVREWQEKWAWPDGATWNSIRYVYDETILAARHQAPTELVGTRRQTGAAYGVVATNAANLPKCPLLPVSPDLLYGQ